VKISGEVGEISIPIVEALPTGERTFGIHSMAIHCAAINLKTKERKKVHG